MLDFLEEASWVTLLVIGAVISGLLLLVFVLFLWPKNGEDEESVPEVSAPVSVAAEGGSNDGATEAGQ